MGGRRSRLAQYSQPLCNAGHACKARKIPGVARVLLGVHEGVIDKVAQAENGRADAIDLLVSRAVGASSSVQGASCSGSGGLLRLKHAENDAVTLHLTNAAGASV